MRRTTDAFKPSDFHVLSNPRPIVRNRLTPVVIAIAEKLREKSVFMIFITITQLINDANIIDIPADNRPRRPYSIM